MPTVLRVGPSRIGFFSNENDEPPHVHVMRERNMAKFWLDPVVELAVSKGFPRHELTEIRAIVNENREQLLEAWNEYFGQ